MLSLLKGPDVGKRAHELNEKPCDARPASRRGVFPDPLLRMQNLPDRYGSRGMQKAKDLYAEAVVNFVNTDDPQEAFFEFYDRFRIALKCDFNLELEPVTDRTFVIENYNLDYTNFEECLSSLMDEIIIIQESYKEKLTNIKEMGLRESVRGEGYGIPCYILSIDEETGELTPPFSKNQFVENGRAFCDLEYLNDGDLLEYVNDVDWALTFCLQRFSLCDKNYRQRIRQCPICGHFFLAKNARRERCYGPECEKAYRREQKRRQREKDPVRYI